MCRRMYVLEAIELKENKDSCMFSPLALPQRPGGDDPETDHEHQQHRPGADGHQGLQHEPADRENEEMNSIEGLKHFYVFALSA